MQTLPIQFQASANSAFKPRLAARAVPYFPATGTTAAAIRPTAKDQVRFGLLPNVTGPIPPGSIVVLVAGMFGCNANMKHLKKFLEDNGHHVYVLTSPFNRFGGNLLASTGYITRGIEQIRIAEASRRYTGLLPQLQTPHTTQEEKVEFLRKHLGLDNTPLGKLAAKEALGLILEEGNGYQTETDFTKRILALRAKRFSFKNAILPGNTAHNQLSSLVDVARERLTKALLPVFMAEKLPGIGEYKDYTYSIEERFFALEKAVDHIIDRIAPRAIVVGHSMGGSVSLLELYTRQKDTAMAVSLAGPGENGTKHFPDCVKHLASSESTRQGLRASLEQVFRGVEQLANGSAETAILQSAHQPFNTTIFTAATEGDTLVGPDDTQMKDNIPGRINVVVTSRPGNIDELMSPSFKLAHQAFRLGHQTAKLAPPYRFIARKAQEKKGVKEFIEGFKQHLALLQYPQPYWSQHGDMLRAVFEAPKNPEGKPDYDEHGKPDYDEAVAQIRRAIHPAMYEDHRTHMLNVLADNLNDARRKDYAHYRELCKAYVPLKDDLKDITRELQPIQDGVAKKAQDVLDLLSA